MSLVEQLQANPRLRVGLVAIVGILALYGLLEWRDLLDSQLVSYKRALVQLARVQQHQRTEIWATRASEARADLEAARRQLWRGPTAGQAQAEVRDWLNSMLRETGAKGSSVRVAEPDAAIDAAAQVDRLPDTLKSLRPLRARVEFNSDPTVLISMLAALNSAEPRVIVDGVSVKSTRSELALTFWFDLVPGSGT